MLGISNMSNTAIAKACHKDIPPKVAFFKTFAKDKSLIKIRANVMRNVT